jgi:alkylation response protein AidB-like acyl-CoA dehydrogenase
VCRHAAALGSSDDADLTTEEEQFQDSVRRFVAERSSLSKLRELMNSGQPYDASVWKQISVQLGLAGLIIPAEHGGAEAGYSALSVAWLSWVPAWCRLRCWPGRWRRARC